ncbi:glyoxalase [Gordonia desulfuricans]|uniref:Glyoxalase n=1 Tax=Gordonia desulfuricans TaxID=89051 RepID=A0A7K3LK32_9ACTN|nr:VOC family protein [Gordonia desulfuricans]NDK88612.1 glyoxalase [Gordonia desulfuricans]
MSPTLFVNLAVAEISRTRGFFEGLGFVFDEMFSDGSTLCMPVTPNAVVMMHRSHRFAGYSAGPVPDPAVGRETVLAISVPARSDVDRRLDAALHCGATVLRPPTDLGFLYARTFCDLDGHAWEVVWTDPRRPATSAC